MAPRRPGQLLFRRAPGFLRFVNRALEPHDSRRALLERDLGDGASVPATKRPCRLAPALELRRPTRSAAKQGAVRAGVASTAAVPFMPHPHRSDLGQSQCPTCAAATPETI
jgi:hypothetical protein